MIGNQKVAVVIPAYRVAREIGEVLLRIPDQIDQVYVVDDASPDNISVGSGISAPHRIVLLRHARNQGVGGAMVTGMRAAMEAGNDILVKCDGDGQMDPRDIPLLIAPLLAGTADHAKGTRFHHVRELRSMPLLRFFGNVGLTFLIKMASGYWNVQDPANGFLATRVEVLRMIPLHKLSRDYFFETDLLIRLNIVKARTVDVPIPACYGRETSSLSLIRVFTTFPGKLFLGLVKRIFWRYVFYDVSPIAVFGALGFVLCGFGMVFGLYEWVKNAWLGVGTPIGTVMLAALPFILGFQLLLQAVVLDIQETPRPGSKGCPTDWGYSRSDET
jgi:dolichol-phosphate mannosyltransferase